MDSSREKRCYVRRLMVVLSISALLVSPVVTLAAEDAPSERVNLGEINVVSTPVIEENETDRYGAQKTTVTEKQMTDLNAQDLSTALRKTPGVNISRYNMIGAFGGGSGGGVFIRGMGSSRPGAEIKMAVDGVPMYMSVWNHPLLDMMAIDAASSVEVYKSPQPQYFGNAMGMVNILPKKKTEEGFATSGGAAVGSHGTVSVTAAHGGKQGDFDYYLGGAYRSSDGHRENADGRTQNVYGRIGYCLSDQWDMFFYTLVSDNYANDPGAEGADVNEREGRYETRSWLTALTVENRFDVATGSIKVYRNAGEGDWLDQPTDTPGVREDLFNDYLFYGVKAKESFYLWPGGELVAGFDWEVTDGSYDQTLTDGSKNDWEGYDFSVTAPYLAVSQMLGDADGWYVIPSAGFRYYDNSEFESESAPHAGLMLGHKDTRLHAGYSRGVLYPGLEVVVMSEMVIPYLGESWKDLVAETSDHYEIGLSHQFGKLAEVDLTWFHEKGKNRYVIVPPPPPPPVYDNVESYEMQGVEATLNIYPSDDFSMFAGMTWLDPEPSDLPYAPELTVSGGANWRFLNTFRLSADFQYVDEMYVDAQVRKQGTVNTGLVDDSFLLNAKLTYGFTATGNVEWEMFVAGENLTDTDYEYLPGYPMPGVTGMIGIGFSM